MNSRLMFNFYRDAGIPETDEEITFDTYRFYLKEIASILKKEYINLEGLADHFSKTYKIKPSIHTLDEKIFRRFLVIAWNTEYLSRTNISQEIEILKISNQWKPIQAYYSIYSAGEAVLYALDGSLVESHSKCLKKLNTVFAERIKISPWCYSYKGDRRGGYFSKNFPSGTSPASNLTRQNVSSVNVIATCVRAEHDNQIDEFEPHKLSKTDKAEGKKKIFKKDYDPGYTTILNFLQRLRIKSNYKDAEIFITNGPNSYIKNFGNDLNSIVNSTLLIFELIIISRWGKDNFVNLSADYIKSFRSERLDSLPLSRRLKIYEQLLKV